MQKRVLEIKIQLKNTLTIPYTSTMRITMRIPAMRITMAQQYAILSMARL